MDSKRYVFAMDLADDPKLIREYDEHHKEIWSEIRKSITGAGVLVMDIYRFGNRLMMIMEVDESFSFDKKAEMDASNPIVQKWENLMWSYQRVIPGANPDEKWVMMNKIFGL